VGSIEAQWLRNERLAATICRVASNRPAVSSDSSAVLSSCEHVRGAFFSQVGERERYSSVLAADITGPDARAQEVDRRIGAASAVYDQLRVGTRTATAVMLYSFGARQGEERGVVEGDLVEAMVSPELDRNVVTAALHDLREELLYLHHAGRRYRFEPKANLNLLIAEERKKYQAEEVLEHVKATLAEALRGARDQAILWPPDSRAIADGTSTFRVVYLDGGWWTDPDAPDNIGRVTELVERCGAARREQKNALAFSVPTADALDRARTAAKTALAIGSLLQQPKQYDLADEQVEDLRERERGVRAELHGAVDRMYETVLVPVAEREGDRALRLETIDLRAQLAGGRSLHERILDGLRKHVFDSLTPARIVTLTKLGTERQFVAGDDLVRWFFSYFDFPKLYAENAIRDAVARGVAATFGYVPSAEVRDGELVPTQPGSVWFGDPLSASEVELGPGTYILDPDLARTFVKPSVPEGTTGPTEMTSVTSEEAPTVVSGVDGPRHLRLRTTANAEQLFRLLPALQMLADKASRFVARLEIKADSPEPFDRTWLRNAVEEHLEEAGVETEIELD
jgi:hypothetical protein